MKKFRKIFISSLAIGALATASFGVASMANTVEAKAETKTFANYQYKGTETSIASTAYSYENFANYAGLENQVSFVDGTTDKGANLVYKIEADEGKYISSLSVAMVGNRLGSFGKAAGVSDTTVSFKPYISTTETFADAIEVKELTVSTECYNLDYDFTSALTSESGTYYVKLEFVGTTGGFYYDWFQLGSVTFTGNEAVHIETYVNAQYKGTDTTIAATTVDSQNFTNYAGLENQVSFVDGTTDKGAYLTYKVEAAKDSYISSLKVEMVGNRLGSFGKAAGVCDTTVSFKPYLSTAETFGNEIESVELPESTDCYNLNYDFTTAIGEQKSGVYYVKLFFVGTTSGFYYDWFQLGSVKITGTEVYAGEDESVKDASKATVTVGDKYYAYTGSEITPTVTVAFQGKTLVEGTDYTVAYENNTEVGVATAKVTFTGKYEGEAQTTFNIYTPAVAPANYSVKAYTPDKFDFVDYYGGAGDIDEEDGDGVTTFAHAGLIVPLKASELEMNTSFKLLSTQSTDNGGDGVDGWCTYSFSATPASESSDSTYPYYGGRKSGYFLHVTNVSSTSAPNCVEIQLVESVNGETTLVKKAFVDNIVNVRFTLKLTKTEEGKYDFSFTNIETGAELSDAFKGLDLLEPLFVNEVGQTFFSTAIYEGAGCDGQHWEHRDVSVYSVKAFNETITDVTLEKDTYEFVEGGKYQPLVEVKTADGTVLTQDEDYLVEYTDNKAIGTATVTVVFVGQYGGNKVTKNFTITEKTTSESESESSGSSEKTEKKGGCGSSIVTATAVLTLLGAGVVVLKKKEN